MTNVDVNNALYKEIIEVIKKKPIEHPSINNFVNKAVKEKLLRKN